jgi:hypothetical protein
MYLSARRIVLGLLLWAACWSSHGTLAEEGAKPKGKVAAEVRRPTVPAGEGLPVDKFMAVYRTSRQLPAPPALSDALFARRVYLDLQGRLPPVAELEAFVADTAANKREALVDRLLADNENYAAHWVSFWQDLLRDGKDDLGSTDIFRPITPWLYASLRDNKPFDRLVRELVDPPGLEKLFNAKAPDQDDGKAVESIPLTEDDPTGFLFGLRAGLEKPRGDLAWQVQGAQNIAQVFLGVPLKCATCHDSFIDSWTMQDAWGLAAIYSEKPLEMVRCELPIGEHASAKFLLPEIGEIDVKASVAERRQQFAQLVTSRNNGLFARTFVNRVWAKLFGVGLVESLDDMNHAAWNADLLDWLAADFIDHDFNVRHTIKTMVLSQAYQTPAVERAPQEKDFVFRGPLLKRMTAEQYLDGIHALLGRKKRVWNENGSKLMEVLGRPDRRTVVLCRESKASTMQSLELLNGSALHELIYGIAAKIPEIETNQGVQIKKPVKLNPPPAELLANWLKHPPEEIINLWMQHALARPATPREREILLDILGEKPEPSTMGDFAWAIVNLPEFQLIR